MTSSVNDVGLTKTEKYSWFMIEVKDTVDRLSRLYGLKAPDVLEILMSIITSMIIDALQKTTIDIKWAEGMLTDHVVMQFSKAFRKIEECIVNGTFFTGDVEKIVHSIFFPREVGN